jgi:hypothetical protein
VGILKIACFRGAEVAVFHGARVKRSFNLPGSMPLQGSHETARESEMRSQVWSTWILQAVRFIYEIGALALGSN